MRATTEGRELGGSVCGACRSSLWRTLGMADGFRCHRTATPDSGLVTLSLGAVGQVAARHLRDRSGLWGRTS
jgi:hypothetical protein